MTGTDWSADLDEFVEGGPLPAPDEPLPEIVGQDDADVWLRRAHRLREDLAEIDDLYHQQIERLNTWRSDRAAGLLVQIERFERHVEQWTRAMLHGSKRRSIALPHGTPSLRKSSTTVAVTDARAFEAWALKEGREQLLNAAKVREPDKRACAAAFTPGPVVEADDDYKRHQAIDEEGQKVPGILLAVPVSDSFSIK